MFLGMAAHVLLSGMKSIGLQPWSCEISLAIAVIPLIEKKWTKLL